MCMDRGRVAAFIVLGYRNQHHHRTNGFIDFDERGPYPRPLPIFGDNGEGRTCMDWTHGIRVFGDIVSQKTENTACNGIK